MSQTPLLDMWQKPADAGEPLGVLATTFTLDPDFFERNCLARFLALESVDEGTGSVEDLVAQLELEEALLAPMVTVLADRSAQTERSTLRWDLLPVHVPTGLLHAKVAVLLWERATRVVVGSANLTPAGYRHNIELAMAADFGPSCILPAEQLEVLAAELDSYLTLVPGLSDSVPAHRQAIRLLGLFQERIAAQQPTRSKLRTKVAPTNASTQPLDALPQVWLGPQPIGATHVSPYWDSNDPAVLTSVRALLTGRPAADRWHGVAVTIGPGGETSFPPEHLASGLVDDVVELGPLDGNVRPLHAKCLVVHSNEWVAALVGSSNHTTAGLGVKGARRHREINIWLGASRSSKEGKALWDLVPVGSSINLDAPYEPGEDEDEPDEQAALPPFFQLCRLAKSGDDWKLTLSFEPSASPRSWRVLLPSRVLVLDHSTWIASGSPATSVFTLSADDLPMFLEVQWDKNQATWAVLADDRHELPPGPGLADLGSSQLLDALANGKSLAQALRESLERDPQEREGAGYAVVTDPLKRFDSRSTLLRRGRALASALAALERRLSRPAGTIDALEARLSGPLGPKFLADRMVAECLAGELPRPDTLFAIAEIALVLSRVQWTEVGLSVDDVRPLVLRTVAELAIMQSRVTSATDDLDGYGKRALQEARRCLAG